MKETVSKYITWEMLAKRYDSIISDIRNSSKEEKDNKARIQRSYKNNTAAIVWLLIVTGIFIALSLIVIFAREKDSKVYEITYKASKVSLIVVFLTVLIISLVMFVKEKWKKQSEKKMDELKTSYWIEALNQVGKEFSYSAEIVYMDIVSNTVIKSSLSRYIKLIQGLIFVSELIFLPVINFAFDSFFEDHSLMTLFFKLLYVLVANISANVVGSKLDELTTMDYKYNEMKFLALEHFKRTSKGEA